MFHKEVKNELDTEDEDSADSSTANDDTEEAWRQVDRLIPFYAGFAQQVRILHVRLSVCVL